MSRTETNNARLGRFMSADPAGGDLSDPQSENRYAYVQNNPTNMTDPSGLCGGFSFGFASDPFSDPFFSGGGDGEGGGGGFGFGFAWGSIACWAYGSDRQPPIYTPPAAHNAVNPFSGETAGIPNGLQIPLQNPLSFLMPSDPSCDFGECGIVQGFEGGDVAEGLAGLCAVQPETCELFTLYVTAWGAYALYQALRPIIESHRTNIRPSTEQKHQEGEARKTRDRGGEKADQKRGYPRKRPKGWKGPWPPLEPGVPYW
jgi:hypothetical protein